jgi:hypothetical protein
MPLINTSAEAVAQNADSANNAMLFLLNLD